MGADRVRRLLRLPLTGRGAAARVARDVDDEIAFHLAMREEALHADGLTGDAARREARRRFGDAERTAAECRAVSGASARARGRAELGVSLAQDLRLAVRGLRRAPLFTAVTALTLALGLGATTAVFSVVSALLLRPLPYHGGDRIVLLGERPVGAAGAPVMSTSYPNFADWQRSARGLEAAALFNGWRPALTGAGEPEVVKGALVTAGVFDVFHVAPALGRPMTAADNEPGSEPVAVLSHAFWQRRFGGSREVVGRRLLLNGRPRTVIGVLPAGFHPPDDLDAELWGSNSFDSSDARSARYLQGVARLAPGVTLAAARAELRAISARLAAAYPQENAGLEAAVTPLREGLVGGVRTPLLLLFGASALVLLIACANAANLLIARGLARERELAVRVALGAGGGRVARELLVESAALAGLGAAAGGALAVVATRAVVRLAPEAVRSEAVGVDARVLAFAVAAALATGVLAGLLPALRARGTAPGTVLAGGGRGSTGGSAARARDVLAVAQIALALTLLAGVGLLVKSFARLGQVDPGIRPDGVLAVSLNLPAARYPDGREPAFHAALLERVRAIPGVRGAAVTSTVPFSGSTDLVSVDVVGRPPRLGAGKLDANRFIVSAGYFRTMGVPLRRGRPFVEADRGGAPLVAVVDEAFARRLVAEAGATAGGSAVGLRVTYGDADTATVVGLVGEVRHAGLDVPSGGAIYLSAAQVPWRWVSVVVRGASAGGAAALAPAVRAAVRAVDPDQPVFGVTTVAALLRERTAGRRFVLTLVGAFAGIALALAALGLYGVMAYAVAQRRRELGIRLAVGASPAAVRRAVLRRGIVLGACGVAAGAAGALAASRVIAGLLFEVRAGDPAVFAGGAAALLAVAAAASYLPARRASRLDPAVTLRGD